MAFASSDSEEPESENTPAIMASALQNFEELDIESANVESSESEDSDSESELIVPITNSAIRRAQNSHFQALLTQHSLSETIEESRTHYSRRNEDLTIAKLVEKRNPNAGNLEPRSYQIELFERAKVQNTIAVLDTVGSGKTLIAVLLLKHTLDLELIDRANGKAPRVAFFLVDSVTLVFQQSAVLKNNINQNIGCFYGAMGPDLWDQQTWDDHLSKYMVIVCTAEILNQCLLNAFLRMKQINLLIFDEAHHAKKEHPYARIIRNSYFTVDQSERPKIFGMTASPIDAKVDVAEAATKLEIILDSKIATTSQLTMLRQIVQKPTEETWTYKKLENSFRTELYDTLETKFGDMQSLNQMFQFSLKATSELGRWCADHIWTHMLMDDVLPKLEALTIKGKDMEGHDPNATQRDMDRIQEAYEIVKAYQHKDPAEPGQHSSKVDLLLAMLTHRFKESSETKCIVFADRRNTAKMLSLLCEQLIIPNIRPGVLVGVRNSDLAGRITSREQFLALVKFREGSINCLFATSVAEEGLDIPDCNLVVRFSLYSTVIQYVQSRGRARHENSTYVTMIEFGNDEHKQRMQEVRRAENLMSAFCTRLPQDRILQGDMDLSNFLQDDAKRIYKIPSSGAKLTYRHAVEVLARYAGSLQYAHDISCHVSYIVTECDNSFTCEIILPETSPIRGLISGPESKKILAKQSAAFDMCILLRKNQLLDDHFRSIYHKRLPAMRNAKLAIVSKETNHYMMRCKPSIWDRERGDLPERLYAIVINFLPSKSLTRKHGSLLLLTRVELPQLLEFSVYLENDTETTIQLVKLVTPLSVSSEDLDSLSIFTLSIFRDLFHKTFLPESVKFPYWIAPIRPDLAPSSPDVLPNTLLDRDSLNVVQQNPEMKWNENMDSSFILNHFIYDMWDGRKRYFPLQIESSLRASDPPPENSPKRRWMDNILSYTLSLSKNSRPRFFEQANWRQPVLQVETVPLRRNFLDKATEAQTAEKTNIMVCPEPLTLSPIPLYLVTSCLAFPAIMSRMESYMIVLEGCQSLDLDIDIRYALEAFTKDSDNTEDHRAMQIHVQRGMGKNYERLEFLGDSFLKMATSISIFCLRPEDDEFDYHVNRMVLICNQNLFNTAVKVKLFEWIRSRGFSRHSWYPPGLQLTHGRNFVKSAASEGTHALGVKTIADVCEALIAAALLSGGKDHRFDTAVKAVTIFVDSTMHNVTSWAGYRALYKKPGYQVQASDGSEIDLADKIFKKMGYRFRYPRLLRSAFTHPSYPLTWARVPCYQRLEFLGDSLLDMVCIEDLFKRFPDKDPQWLTEHKMAMVSNKFLGALCVKLKFHRHMAHFSSPIQAAITNFAEEIQAAEDESQGAMDYWLAIHDSPKCLPDIIEAYVAAIFVDSDFDYTVVEEFFISHVKPFFVDISLYDTFANRHPTTYLYRQLTDLYGCTNYCLKSGELPTIDGEQPVILAAVMIHGISVAQCTGTSSRYAKVRASEKALSAIGGMLLSEFCKKFHCDCREKDDKENFDDRHELDKGTAI
ncbi:dicer-like protein 1 [Penicillium taxi]|uniref:dicer-like protein 1 n=1 Tax=Penicillium taxi TaxID=168475 RepID=UPI0025458339|nr:dicer-like protein 1 [Penicillium taxi]KAJ5893547.1 dicer-like protein 1 [Penicillium taxi]